MFYDPATKKLLGKYQWYADFFETELKLYRELQKDTTSSRSKSAPNASATARAPSPGRQVAYPTTN